MARGGPSRSRLSGCWWAGRLIGVALGYLVSLFVSRFDDHLIETATTFCVAYGSYLLANELHTSGLLAVVCAALTMTSYGRRVGMSQNTVEAVDLIWEFVGFIANCFLFLLLGIQIGEANLAPAVSPIIWAVIGVIVGRALMIYLLLPLHDALGTLARAARAIWTSTRRANPVELASVAAAFWTTWRALHRAGVELAAGGAAAQHTGDCRLRRRAGDAGGAGYRDALPAAALAWNPTFTACRGGRRLTSRTTAGQFGSSSTH